jgi:protein TonB
MTNQGVAFVRLLGGLQMIAGRWTGVLFVAALHGAALYVLIAHQTLPLPVNLSPVFVEFIAPPSSETHRQELPKPSPVKERSIELPLQRQLMTANPAQMPSDYVGVVPPGQPEPVAEVRQPAPPSGPLKLGSELSVACPERRAPVYPMVSRRMGDTGVVVLWVELEESGAIAFARVEKSSGHVRLDDAALAAVKMWKCNVPIREGRPVRAVALQPFNFMLEGR